MISKPTRAARHRHVTAPALACAPFAIALTFAVAVSGCVKTDEKACSAAKSAIANAVSTRDFTQARSLRAEAYRTCEDRKALAAVDTSITDGEANRDINAAAEARSTQTQAALLRVFLGFVQDNRSAPEQASNAPRCVPLRKPAVAPVDAGAPQAEALCTARRQIGSRHVIQLNYAQPDPSAFRFFMLVPGAVDCKALGGTAVKSWNAETPTGIATRVSRCELGGPLSGLAAVVESGPLSSVHVFSPSYLERVPDDRRILDAPGS